MLDAAQAGPLRVRGPFADLLGMRAGESAESLQLELGASGARSEGDVLARLTVLDVLRMLPGRRVVCKALLDEVPVLVKWFLGEGALRYQQRELRGNGLLRQVHAPTPAILGAFDFVSGGQGTGDYSSAVDGSALVFEYLDGAEQLTDEHLATDPGLFPKLWRLLAGLHSAGVVHNDLHFGNLMTDGKNLWLIDGDAVARASDRSLGLLQSAVGFVQLAAQTRSNLSYPLLQSYWQSYCSARQIPSEAISPAVLIAKYRASRRRRIRQFQAKTCRNCSDFAFRRTLLGSALLDRRWLAELGDEELIGREMLGWLDSLPRLMAERDGQAGKLLKRGNTATVVAASFHEQALIVKRYNNKSRWHRLYRLLRPDRGVNSWVYAHTLAFTGISTAPAVALLRTRFGGPTYLVMRKVDGVELHPELFEGRAAADAFERFSQKLVDLLNALAAEGLVHRDTKASNFLWNGATDTLALIDLDAMEMPASRRTQLNGHERDRRRFLRNFAATPDLQRRLASLLGAGSG